MVRVPQSADYMRAYRAANPEHVDRQRLVARARARALTRLAERHADECAALVVEERLRLGVPPRRRGRPARARAEAVVMPKAALRRCSMPGCSQLVAATGRHRCAEHDRQNWQRVNEARAMPRHRGARWERVRAAFLHRHPLCADCGAPATVADHAPTSRRALIAAHGASRADPATVGLGISVDEIQRVRTPVDPLNPEQRRDYPLIDLGLSRADCAAAISAGGLPMPEKSSCWFCPYTRAREWQRRRHEQPDLFWQGVRFERTLQELSVARGREPVHLCRHGVNLDELTSDEQQLALFDGTPGSDCETGYCMT